MREPPGIRYLILILFLLCLLLTSCTPVKIDSLSITPGKLTVLIRNIPTVYYEGPEGKMGFEYDLVKAFADHLGLELKLKIVDSVTDILKAIENGEADLVAAGLTRTDEREKRLLFGPDYFTVQQQVIGNRKYPYPKKVEELQNFDLVVLKNTSYVEKLKGLQQQYPHLQWQETDEYSTDQLLEQVWLGKISCTVSDSNILAMNRRYFPELMVAFPISEKQHLAWIINKKKLRLRAKLSQWFATIKDSGQLAELKDRYYSYIEIFDYVDIKIFTRRISSRLPGMQTYFEKYSNKYNLPWTLIAAKAYQESHWDPEAVSPTGVKGIMMLTWTTATSLGIKNRENPEQSIKGGARYFRQLLDRVPKTVPEKQRSAFAMAAYNIGMGHIYDARKLARRLGKDPDSWKDIKTVLPLLSRKKYYKTLQHGYARGYEPVRYVDRIFNYRNILEQKLGLLSTHPG
ncbi:MAG: membrane-bound lytic murein transglycosylase MltF [Xanthomonadaceae bacterium]|nr:membrane-bound lytic murein transglycosylase MltF [Xanthomonadaceae bacterium]